MKTAIIYFLLSPLLLQNSGLIAVMVWFEVNQPEIAGHSMKTAIVPSFITMVSVFWPKIKAIAHREKRT